MNKLIVLALFIFIANTAWAEEADSTSTPSPGTTSSPSGTVQKNTQPTPPNNDEQNDNGDVEYVYIVTQLA